MVLIINIHKVIFYWGDSNPFLFRLHCALSPPWNLICSFPQCPPSRETWGLGSHLPPGLAQLLSCYPDSAPQFQKTCYPPATPWAQSLALPESASGSTTGRRSSSPPLNLSLPRGVRIHDGPGRKVVRGMRETAGERDMK